VKARRGKVSWQKIFIRKVVVFMRQKFLRTIYIFAWIVTVLCILTYGTVINSIIVTINIISLLYLALTTYATTRKR
jgi:hypothetical protein